MREIKFRGKRLDNGEWVYGNYFIDERDIEDGFIWREIPQIQQRYGDHYQYFDIINDTIGQYTGLKDKNGQEIYEGDIVKNMKRGFAFRRSVVIYNSGKGRYDVKAMGCLFPMTLDWCEDDIDISGSDYEVIGNIHDNPELLEEWR